MDEDGSSAAAVSKWGFRRSTIARREFMEAVGSVDSSAPVQRRRGRPPRGRGRGRGRRGRGRVPALTPAGDRWSGETEAQPALCEERVPSDRAEDSDDLNLQEIRKRAVARKLQELKHDAGATGPEDMDVGLRVLMVSEDTDITSDGGKLCSSTGTGAGETSVAAAEEQLQEEVTENKEEDAERMNPDAVCCTCQQGHSNRLMLCCESCRAWRHVDCVSETCAHLLQKNREYVCPSCSDDRDATSKNTATNGLSQKHEIDSTHVVEIKQPVEEEMKAAVSKCIGPGCGNDSLPESVYCGHQCIVRHAAAAMKSLSEPKTETKPAAPPADPPLKSEKRSFLAKLFKVKISKTPAQEECVSKPETDEESPCSATVDEPVQSATASAPAPDYKPTVKEKDEVECSASTLQSLPSDSTPDVGSSEKALAAPLMKKCTPGRAKKTMPGSPRLELLKGALSKSPLSISKKPSESSRAAEAVPCGPGKEEPAAAPHASPLLTRQNIRRSLTTLLCSRFSQSEDMKVSESEIEKLAVDMEKEMFNMCYTTDEEYKNKYQHLVLTLKDPKNKELCHQVLKGLIPSAKLIQLSQQEEPSVDALLQISVKKEPSLVSEAVEDAEKVMSIDTSSPSTVTPPEEKSSLKLPQVKGAPDVISCMLKDTTAEHKRHLFDLNCRICTGQVSTDGDPQTKKPKVTLTKEEMEKEKSSWVVHMMGEALDSSALESDIIESPASPSGEDLTSQGPSADFSPVLIPSVPTVSISRRDPRTAQYRQAPPPSGVPESASVPPQPVKSAPVPLKEALPPPLPAPMLKSILMKPSPASLDTSYASTTRLADCDK